MEKSVLSSGRHRAAVSNGNTWRGPAFVLTLGVIAGSLVSGATEAQTNRNKTANEAQFTVEGAERCLRCHAGETMTIVADTAHGNSENPNTPYAQHGCESCHGPGSLHVSRARGGRGLPALVVFGDSETVGRQTDACTACHADDMGDLEGMEWDGSAHDTDTMTCVTCHDAHIVGNPLTEQKKQLKSCANCHNDEISAHPRFEDKGIVFDNLTCYDCHDVHQLIREP
jgi:DmsE family decaheme c-type cytochrome